MLVGGRFVLTPPVVEQEGKALRKAVNPVSQAPSSSDDLPRIPPPKITVGVRVSPIDLGEMPQ